MTSEPVPEGFEPRSRKSPATDPWEPLYSRRVADVFQIGVRARDVHCNARGLVHGGVIAALADIAMGWSYAISRDESFKDQRRPLTASLGIDYIGNATPGQWLQVEPRLVKVGRGTGIVDALVTADGQLVARANAMFRVPSE